MRMKTIVLGHFQSRLHSNPDNMLSTPSSTSWNLELFRAAQYPLVPTTSPGSSSQLSPVLSDPSVRPFLTPHSWAHCHPTLESVPLCISDPTPYLVETSTIQSRTDFPIASVPLSLFPTILVAVRNSKKKEGCRRFRTFHDFRSTSSCINIDAFSRINLDIFIY